jgi:hypothetical protein
MIVNEFRALTSDASGIQGAQLCLQTRRRGLTGTIIFSRFSVEWETAETRLFL